ncbi:MAG: hypothetical protein ACKOZM_04425 [Flavobacteriales bacterium]
MRSSHFGHVLQRFFLFDAQEVKTTTLTAMAIQDFNRTVIDSCL